MSLLYIYISHIPFLTLSSASLTPFHAPSFPYTFPSLPSPQVTCITTSTAYNIILSGSRDETCIIWHLSSLEFVRQLRNHGAPVAAVQVNDLTVSGNTVDLEVLLYLH